MGKYTEMSDMLTKVHKNTNEHTETRHVFLLF